MCPDCSTLRSHRPNSQDSHHAQAMSARQAHAANHNRQSTAACAREHQHSTGRANDKPHTPQKHTQIQTRTRTILHPMQNQPRSLLAMRHANRLHSATKHQRRQLQPRPPLPRQQIPRQTRRPSRLPTKPHQLQPPQRQPRPTNTHRNQQQTMGITSQPHPKGR